MKFIMVAIGSHGDVYPFLGIGAVLKKRGHTVTVLANSYFENATNQAGLDFYSIGSADEYLDMIGKSGEPDMRRAICDYLFIRPMKPVFDYCASHYIKGETVAVCNISSLGTRLANEKFGLPMISINLTPMMFMSSYDPPLFSIQEYPVWVPRWAFSIAIYTAHRVFDRDLCPSLNRLRKEIGLPPQRRVLGWMLSPYKVIGLFPEWFAKPQPDWPAQVELTGFPLFDEGHMHNSVLSPELEQFLSGGDAPIVITPGTTNYKYSSFFEKAVEATSKLGVRAILVSKFQEQIPRNLPAHVRFFEYLPFSNLLSRTSAVVHHGGIGTLAQILKAGIPQLIAPWGIDQFDNGARIKALGLGGVISSKRCTAKSLADAIYVLMNSPEVHERCKEISCKINASDPIHDTCRIIEAFGKTVST